MLAGWLAGASALMGCAYAMSAAGAEQAQSSHDALAALPESTDGHHCCSKPASSDEPARPAEQGQFQECCSRVAPATVSKGESTQVQLALSDRLPAGIEPAISPEFHAGIEPAKEDSSGDYLLFRVLRI